MFCHCKNRRILDVVSAAPRLRHNILSHKMHHVSIVVYTYLTTVIIFKRHACQRNLGKSVSPFSSPASWTLGA